MILMDQERLTEIERLLKVAADDLSHLQKQKGLLIDQISTLNSERENLLHTAVEESRAQYSRTLLTSQSSEKAKIGLFRSLFRGREDI
jgi:hypothetical protein